MLPGMVPIVAGKPGKAPIEFVGATGTNSLPTHQAGDLLIAFAFRGNGSTAPALASGWTSIVTASQTARSLSLRVGYLFATGSGTSFGTWTNATRYGSIVLRNASGIGDSAAADNQSGSNSITFPALTMEKTDNTSWAIRAYGALRVIAWTPGNALPAGYTSRFNDVYDINPDDEEDWYYAQRGGDTNGPVSSVGSSTVSNGSGNNFGFAVSIEILN